MHFTSWAPDTRAEIEEVEGAFSVKYLGLSEEIVPKCYDFFVK